MLVDTHCHAFDDRIDFYNVDLSNLQFIVVCSYNMENLEKCINFCNEHKKCFCALGVHPQYAANFDKQKFDKIIEIYKKQIVAIGEIGLDCDCDTDYKTQLDVFCYQMEIANKLNLPVSIHLKGKTDFENFFKIKQKYSNVICVLHCFNGDEKDLKQALSLNCYISFAGNITYRANIKKRELLKSVPLKNLVLETDCPSMLPANFARKGVNTCANLIYTLNTVAKVLNIDKAKLESITTENAKNIFKITEKIWFLIDFYCK